MQNKTISLGFFKSLTDLIENETENLLKLLWENLKKSEPLATDFSAILGEKFS